MGLSNLQGTHAFIEYYGERKTKKYSCKNCKNYFDGVCKAKNITIDYGDNSGKYCSWFDPINSISKSENTEKKKNNTKREAKGTSSNVTTALYINGKIQKEHKIKKDVVEIGCKVTLQELQSANDEYEFEIREDTSKELKDLILNHGKGYKFKYRNIMYRIKSIKFTEEK
ncbi:hypothetical protein GOM49_10445 [Clostridium bovifaecis]|uniref:Uncharacterized protein n=1 Tax=Clostridium bovifaecis TaxID=2184719 RepID=A0A6I6EP25_9CLOT|nr:hypothetical protein GOM49_10445 [Clostridium bovifaecis]